MSTAFIILAAIAVAALLLRLSVGQVGAESSEIPAQGVITVDLQSGSILVNQDAGDAVETPGLNRLLTVYAALLLWPDASSSTIVISGADLEGVATDSPSIEAGTSASFNEIIRAALVAGRPEAARALARGAGSASGLVEGEALHGFVERANDLFAQLGLTHTKLDLDGAMTQTTAAELAQLTATVLDAAPSLVSVFASADAVVDGRTVPSALVEDGQQRSGVAAPENQSLLLLSQQGQRSVVAILLGVQSDEWLTVASDVIGQSLALATANTSGANYPKLPDLQTSGAPSAAVDASTLTAPTSSELTVRKLMLRWPLAILSILMLAAVVAIQRPEIRRLRSKTGPRRFKRPSTPTPAPMPVPIPQVATFTSWETEPQASTAGD